MRLVDRRHTPALLAVLALLDRGVRIRVGPSGESSSTDDAGAPTSASGTVSVVMKSLDFSPLDGARPGRADRHLDQRGRGAAQRHLRQRAPVSLLAKRLSRSAQRFSIHLTEAGTIHYICTLHPWMRASVIVSG